MKKPPGSKRKTPRSAKRPKRSIAAVEVAELEAMRVELERLAAAPPPRWNADPDDVRRSVVKLVLTLVEFVRQLLERQAIRRMDAGTLTAGQTEAVGLALMRLEETVRDLGGFIAEVSVAVTPQLKTIAGRLAYLIGGAQVLFEFEPVGASITMQPGSVHLSRPLYTFAVCNSRLIAGGRLIAPAALIDDGLLDVCLIEAMSALEFVALARKVADGAHVEDPRVLTYQVESVRIDLDREVKVNTDGEVFQGRCCEYRVRPRAARFLAGDGAFTAAA